MQERKPGWKIVLSAIAGSYVCLAFIGLVLFDAAARLTYSQWNFDRYNTPNRSWIWWAAKDFHSSHAQPDIVLMGSSLMMAALHGGDATALNTPQNVAYHHRSTYFENLLAKQFGQPVSTYAFAIGGQMASDAYAIASTLMTGEQRPRTIIYGIAPRDLMDNTLASPASTETFRLMSRLGNMSDVALSARTAFWERAEYEMGRVSFLYDHRPDFVYLQNKLARDVLRKTLGMKDMEYAHVPFPLRKIAMLQLPEDNAPNELFILPYNKASDKYTDNLPEYRSRYRAFKPKLFEMQLSFMERLLKFCDQQGISMVLVNMPLTPENVALMPPGFYANYQQRIAGLASTYHARVIDMNDPNVFGHECFADSVHLNGYGGKRFFEVLSTQLRDDSFIAVSRHQKLK